MRIFLELHLARLSWLRWHFFLVSFG
jgi:hypothetical protein